MDRIGLRAAGRLAGCSHAHIKRLADLGQLPRGRDGLFDPADVLRVKARADPGLVRKPPPKGGDEVVTRRPKAPRGHQSPPEPVTTLPPADADALWTVLAGLPALVAWSAALGGTSLQTAHDLAADLALDVGGDLVLRGFSLPGPLEPINWRALAEEAGLGPIDPKHLAADWQRRRDAD